MLDAAYNMERLYKIDPKRVYIFGGGDWADADGKQNQVGPRMGLFYPEVFTGMFTTNLLLYRRASGTGNTFYDPQIPGVDRAQLQLAATHPVVVGTRDDSEFFKATAAAYKADGFKFGKVIPVSQDQYHYPNLTTDWLPDVLKYMDGVTADLKLPAENGTTK